MDSNSIRFDLLFDAEEYHRSGNFPWTFFAYPTSLASAWELPPDIDACQLLATLQKRGICVAVWVSGICENTSFFACRKEYIQKLNGALKEIEVCGMNGMDFCITRSQELFALVEDRSHP